MISGRKMKPSFLIFSNSKIKLSFILGISFSIQAIGLLNLGSFKAGALLLAGLFFYDIFWVFGTEVMVKVATKFVAPVKILFPRDLGALPPSMLGLGDIVMPGIFIAAMLRFDAFLQEGEYPKKAVIPKKSVYFFACLFSYFIGISTTVYVMYAFNHAQPALLYLSPACVLSVALTSLFKKEFMSLWNYSEPEEDEQVKKDDKLKAE